MKLVRKDDHSVEVIGTLERLSGRAGFAGATRLPDGTLELDWDGGTEVFWEEQRTVKRDGHRVFLTEEGDEVLECDLELIEDEEEAE